MYIERPKQTVDFLAAQVGFHLKNFMIVEPITGHFENLSEGHL